MVHIPLISISRGLIHYLVGEIGSNLAIDTALDIILKYLWTPFTHGFSTLGANTWVSLCGVRIDITAASHGLDAQEAVCYVAAISVQGNAAHSSYAATTTATSLSTTWLQRMVSDCSRQHRGTERPSIGHQQEITNETVQTDE